VVQEIFRFLKADIAFMNIRPLRYSLVLDPRTDALPRVSAAKTKRNLELRDAVLTNFHQHEVVFRGLLVLLFLKINLLKMIKS
jgi:hypothetical protein